MYQTYDLSRCLDGDLAHSTSITVSDDDAINCAHMLAAGFNTISRNMMGDFVLGVVDTKAGTVQYDGKVEQIKRDEPKSDDTWPENMFFSKTFKFEASTEENADTLVTLFDDENGKLVFPGKFKIKQPSKYEFISRPVLEAAYAELEAVKNVLFDAGVETIPADAGVRDLLAVKRDMSAQISARDAEIAEFVQERLNRDEANTAARVELIEHVKRAYAKWGEVDPGRQREGMKAHLRGMIEVLSKFLAATGEADHDERHAAALRVCGIPEGNYLYVDD